VTFAIRRAAGIASAFAALLLGPAASAQTFISAVGNDANTCSRAAPCRSLQRGIDATGAGRELTILDSGEYGRATIAKSITISATGVAANIRQLAFDAAITIDNASAHVVLRGLSLFGGGVGQSESGVDILRAAAVHIQDCQIERFGLGVVLRQSASAELFVADSAMRINSSGIEALGSSAGGSTLRVVNSRFENNNGDGVASSVAQAWIMDSIASGNSRGFVVYEAAVMIVTGTTAANNQIGFLSAGIMTLNASVSRGNSFTGLKLVPGGSARLAGSVLTNNGVGIENGGTLLTRGNNMLDGNTNDYIGDAAQSIPPA
jgi:hypothetical protein